MKQTQLSAFISFKTDVFDMSQTNMTEVVNDNKQNDAIARTAIDLTQNTEIHNDIKRQLELLREVRVITPFVYGESCSKRA